MFVEVYHVAVVAELVKRTMFPISRRRRNILLACGAVAAGSYVTYRVYHSRKRLRVFLFFQSFSSLLDALSQGSNSFAVVLSDLHGFLRSEEDEVPPTLKQLLKLTGSQEAQESISALSAAISRGLLSSVIGAVSIEHEEQPRRLQSSQSRLSSPRGSRNSEKTGHLIEWGGKDTQGTTGAPSTSLNDTTLSPYGDENAEEFSRDCDGVLDGNSLTNAEHFLDGVKAQVDFSIVRGAKESSQEGLGVGPNPSGNEVGMDSGKRDGKEELVDKLVEKLFSEPGKGFVSAVVASASRSFVLSIIEHINTSNLSSKDGETGSAGGLVKGLAAFANSPNGKSILTDCIQTFVGTAVSVYLEQTKDINTFDEIVAGLVKPEHQGPITDLLTTVCKVSTSSFVRTSHEVLTSDPSSSSHSAVTKTTDFGDLSHDNEDIEVFYDMGEQEPVSPSQSPIKWKGKAVVGSSEPRPINYVEEISKVIAVPSNRKLILDIAGTVTSSGVRSMIDVSLDKVSAVLGGKGKDHAPKDQSYGAPKWAGVGEKLQAVGDATKAAMDKSMVLMTMCFAVCLHSVVGGVRMIQPF